MSSIAEFQKQVREGKDLRITGDADNTDKEFINISSYSGVVEYFPEELVITLKAGTTIQEITNILATYGQALPFFTESLEKTIGAIYATSGPEFSDSVLGVQIINGKGELLNFGGQVMKNVAGYDVSKLLVGSMGRLALVTQISLKILPQRIAKQFQLKPPPKHKVSEISLNFESKLKKVFDPYGVFI
jgi:glycolate oxidase FAD binding subunit